MQAGKQAGRCRRQNQSDVASGHKCPSIRFKCRGACHAKPKINRSDPTLFIEVLELHVLNNTINCLSSNHCVVIPIYFPFRCRKNHIYIVHSPAKSCLSDMIAVNISRFVEKQDHNSGIWQPCGNTRSVQSGRILGA